MIVSSRPLMKETQIPNQPPPKFSSMLVYLGRLFACSLEFHHTLKIAARPLSDVVTRVRLCGHYALRGSRGEVQSRAVVRRRGEGECVCMLIFLEEY